MATSSTQTKAVDVMRQGRVAAQDTTSTKPPVNWRWVWRKVRWPIVVFAITIAIVFLPRLWGWHFHRLGTGNGSWSMASEKGGIMPLSVYYTKRTSGYYVGDKISFEYRGSSDTAQNGPSVKQVVAVNRDGTYKVAGTNLPNSIAPCDVRPEDVNGKIVLQFSPLPKAYWRWVSLGWNLTNDEITKRNRMVFSLNTVIGVFTTDGRLRNQIVFRYPPSSIKSLSTELGVVEDPEDNRIKVFFAGEREPRFTSEMGYMYRSLEGDELVLCHPRKTEMVRVNLLVLATRTITAPTLELPARVEAIVRRNDKGLALQTLSVPYELPERFICKYGDRSFRVKGGIKLGELQELGNRPGTMFVAIPPLGGLASGSTIEVELLPDQ